MQRSYLRSLANSIPAIFQIGKNGMEPNSIRQFDEALEARELVKASVMRNSPLTAREAAERLAVELGADVIQVLGNLLYCTGNQKRTRLYNFSKKPSRYKALAAVRFHWKSGHARTCFQADIPCILVSCRNAPSRA